MAGRTTFLCAILVVIAATPIVSTQADSGTIYPERFKRYLTNVVQLTPAEREQLFGSAPVTKMLEGDASRELAVFGAVWVKSEVSRYLDWVSDVERFESGGGFRVTKRISSPPRIEDFAAFRVPPEDFSDLRSCRVGNCELKLGERALGRLRKEIDWSSANAPEAANALLRQLVFEYVTGYEEGGNDRLAVYRDDSRPTFVGQEFRSMVGRMPELTSYMKSVGSYLLEYPKVTLPNSTSFLYWQEVEFGLKPIVRVSHMTVYREGDAAVIASKLLYSSHYFWTGLELRVLVPDPARGPGFWFVTVNRTRSDGLGGFTGRMVRGRVRDEVRQGVQELLKITKEMLETN